MLSPINAAKNTNKAPRANKRSYESKAVTGASHKQTDSFIQFGGNTDNWNKLSFLKKAEYNWKQGNQKEQYILLGCTVLSIPFALLICPLAIPGMLVAVAMTLEPVIAAAFNKKKASSRPLDYV